MDKFDYARNIMSVHKKTNCGSRLKKSCFIFGKPEELSASILPSREEVGKYILLQEKIFSIQIKDQSANITILGRMVYNAVALKIKEIWHSAGIPTISNKRIIALLKTLQTQRQNVNKTNINRRDTDNFKKKINVLLVKNKRLFDVAGCKCRSFKDCNYPLQKKVVISLRYSKGNRSSLKFIYAIGSYRTPIISC